MGDIAKEVLELVLDLVLGLVPDEADVGIPVGEEE